MAESYITRIEALIDEALPDEKIKADIASILWPEGEAGRVEINEEWITIPSGCEIAITTKVFVKQYYRIRFGVYKAQIAIGGVVDVGGGFYEAGYCWATIYYNIEDQWLTIDFYEHER